MVAPATSELVRNAAVHAPRAVRVVVARRPRATRRAVEGARPVSGCGLQLVEAMAERWGVDDAAPGTSVWCEVRR